MPFFKRHPPAAVYRGTILLACLAFLLGVSGIFYFRHLDTRGLPPGDTASVLVHGVEDDPDIEVVAEWTVLDGDGSEVAAATGEPSTHRKAERGRLGEEPGIYLFRRAPEGVPLELIVYRHTRGQRVELHRQLAILTYGQSIYTAVPWGPAGDPGEGPAPAR